MRTGNGSGGDPLAQGLLTWAHTLFLKFVFSAGGTVAAPAPSVQQRAVSFEIWRQILKKWLGQEEGELNNSLELDSPCFLSILKYELCKHSAFHLLKHLPNGSQKPFALFYILLLCLPSSPRGPQHHLSVLLPTQSPQTSRCPIFFLLETCISKVALHFSCSTFLSLLLPRAVDSLQSQSTSRCWCLSDYCCSFENIYCYYTQIWQ